MVTGIETAGLALAVFPLAITAISSYAEGCRKIRSMIHHGEELKKFSIELKDEYIIFQNICDKLLENIIPRSDLDELLNPTTPQRGAELWESEDLYTQLKTQLNERTVEAFIQSIKGLYEVIITVNKIFPNDEGKGPKKLAKLIKDTFKYSVLSNYREDRLAEVRQYNKNLVSFSDHGRISSDANIGSKPQAIAAVKFYARVQKKATSLFTVLKEKLAEPTCSCPSSHNTELQLEFRESSNIYSKKLNYMRFRTFISVEAPQSWREVDVEPLEEIEGEEVKDDHLDVIKTTSKASAETLLVDSGVPSRVTSRCTTPEPGDRSPSLISNFKRKTKRVVFGTITTHTSPELQTPTPDIPELRISVRVTADVSHKSETTNTSTIHRFCPDITRDSCYGVLIDREKRRHRVWPPEKPVCHTQNSTLINLRDLLQRQDQRQHQKQLTLIQRLTLGRTLASSVLQLHSSGWLPEEWGAQDIIFFDDPCNGVLFDNPMIRRPTPTRNTRTSVWLMPCNKTLFSLGIVLIELYYGKCLDQCSKDILRNPEEMIENLRFQIADQMVDVLYRGAVESYSDAVRRCIRGIDHMERNLENVGFKQEVYRGVLFPLEKTLKMYYHPN